MDEKIIVGIKILRKPNGETGKVTLLCAPATPELLLSEEEMFANMAGALHDYIEAKKAVRQENHSRRLE